MIKLFFTTDASDITLYFRQKGHSEESATAPVRVTLYGVSGDASGSHYEFATYPIAGRGVWYAL